MSLFAKMLLSLLIAMIAGTLTSTLLSGEPFDPRLLLAFFLATATTAFLVRSGHASTHHAREELTQPPAAPDGIRERGTVKWFNGSKGFGFIVRKNGEEIFVHFRSIRGEGRRALRDGQSVSFIVGESNKGPQAVDVIGED